MTLARVGEDAFKALGTLARADLLTQTSLDLGNSDRPLTYDRYETLGAFLGAMNRSCSWWIGDWLNYGEGEYGDRMWQAATATGLSEETLKERMRVCGSIAPSRRRPNLPFSVHEVVWRLPPAQQTLWLKRAEQNGWTAAQLKREMLATETEQQELLPPEHPPARPAAVLDAARQVVRSAQRNGAMWLVPAEQMAQLIAAVGEEE
jgi:hypothetical protein